MRARLCPVLLILAVLSFLSACRLTSPPPASPPPSTVDVVPEQQKPVEDPVAAPRQKIRQQLAADDSLAALTLILASGLPETEFADEYVRALKGVLNQAEGLLQKDLPEKAGPLYRAVLNGYPKKSAVAARVGMSPDDIATGIETCADRLMERGLADYRSGNLDQAIRTWKQIHVFAPRHQASRKALQTAEVQLANLKKVRGEQ